jgi:hypothetical protein
MRDEEIRQLWEIKLEWIDKAKEYLEKLFGDGLNCLVIEKSAPKKRGRKKKFEK